MISFLVRSDNAICLPGKKGCVKIGKEKKQVYVPKEYLCNLYNKYEQKISGRRLVSAASVTRNPKKSSL